MKLYWHERERGKAWRLVMTPKAIICNVELLSEGKYLASCLGCSIVMEGTLESVRGDVCRWVASVIEEVKKLLLSS